MAIFYMTASNVSRASGGSAVKSASYRSGEELVNTNTGEVHKYSRADVAAAFIMAPKNSPDWVMDRQSLWSKVEFSEKRKKSRVAREIKVAFPRELSFEENEKLIRDYVKTNFVSDGMIADVAMHGQDSGNPHAHILLTTRRLEHDKKNGGIKFGKKVVEWNDYIADKNGTGGDLLVSWRKSWADLTNSALAKANSSERISHLSYKDQGIDKLPGVHIGPQQWEIEKRAKADGATEPVTHRGKHNKNVISLNDERERRAKEKANAEAIKADPEAWVTLYEQPASDEEFTKLCLVVEKLRINSPHELAPDIRAATHTRDEKIFGVIPKKRKISSIQTRRRLFESGTGLYEVKEFIGWIVDSLKSSMNKKPTANEAGNELLRQHEARAIQNVTIDKERERKLAKQQRSIERERTIQRDQSPELEITPVIDVKPTKTQERNHPKSVEAPKRRRR